MKQKKQLFSLLIIFFIIGNFVFFPDVSIGQGVKINIEANKKKCDKHTSELVNFHALYKAQNNLGLAQKSQKVDLVKKMSVAAKARSQALDALMQEDPQIIFQLAMTPEQIEEFPQEVQVELEEHVDMEGVLETIIKDYFDEGVSLTDHSLIVGDQRYSLHSSEEILDIVSGSRIQVKGIRVKKRIAVPQKGENK
ncbi:hypothetical protein MNBD_UNCLBAC01-1029 [hydrothermal vent metagenome]|uniref:Uncharacterized protein n=1 Tax=hydrothermal vent metagenome TaxID=652676 RepID=A0A3B1DH09_9ZZZZ